MAKNIIVIYHANCPDGFGAAWSFYKKYGLKATYIPMSYGDPIPDLSNKEVYFVDFCLHKEQLLEIKNIAESITVLDHHKTANDECGDLDFCHFDMNHSGAVLAWKHCFPYDSVPYLLRYVEDRDLWKWQIPSSQEILSVVDSVEKTFENWDNLSYKINVPGSDRWNTIRCNGQAIMEYKKTLIQNIIKNVHYLTIDGKRVPAVNTPFYQSEIGNQLSVDKPFAAAYYWNGDRYCFSLRSNEGGSDVSVIAKKYGGGGHVRASGFTIQDISLFLT